MFIVNISLYQWFEMVSKLGQYHLSQSFLGQLIIQQNVSSCQAYLNIVSESVFHTQAEFLFYTEISESMLK